MSTATSTHCVTLSSSRHALLEASAFLRSRPSRRLASVARVLARRTNLADLIETTHVQHYEEFRSESLAAKKEKKAAKKTAGSEKAAKPKA